MVAPLEAILIYIRRGQAIFSHGFSGLLNMVSPVLLFPQALLF